MAALSLKTIQHPLECQVRSNSDSGNGSSEF